MARYVFRLPDIGEGIAEAEIVAWHVKPGEMVEEDQLLADVMTDKATVEMTSPVAGSVITLHGEVGQTIQVGAPLVELQTAEDVPVQTPEQVEEHARPLASPATRRRARERNIQLQAVPGTGPDGRVTANDLYNVIAQRSKSSQGMVSASADATERKITGLRARIAEKMEIAARRIPHFSYVEEFDLTELQALRTELNNNRRSEHPKLSLLPFLMRALAKVLPDFPSLNAHYDDDGRMLKLYQAIHVGIATQTENGLLVPVVRHVESLGLWQCARELARVTSRAREGAASREELTGSTITITSLGALGGVAATPIINHPEVAILAPNRLIDRPVIREGQIAVRTMMNISSSFDHRIIDGYIAAQFMQSLKRLLERPALLFLIEE